MLPSACRTRPGSNRHHPQQGERVTHVRLGHPIGGPNGPTEGTPNKTTAYWTTRTGAQAVVEMMKKTTLQRKHRGRKGKTHHVSSQHSARLLGTRSTVHKNGMGGEIQRTNVKTGFDGLYTRQRRRTCRQQRHTERNAERNTARETRGKRGKCICFASEMW